MADSKSGTTRKNGNENTTFFYSEKWNQEGYPSGNMSFEYHYLQLSHNHKTIKGIAGGECSTNNIPFVVLDYITENYDNHKYSYVDKNGCALVTANSKNM